MRQALLRPILLRSGVFSMLWWVLAEANHNGWALGALAVLLATWTSLVLLPSGKAVISPSGLIRFLGFFLWHSIHGGALVAWMAVRGRTALQPGLVEVSMKLSAGGQRVFLINILGLMPGTVGVEAVGDTLLIHALDERLPVIDDLRSLELAIGDLFGNNA